MEAGSVRIEMCTGPKDSEYKWVVFVENKRGSVGKLVAEVTVDPPNGAKSAFVKSLSVRSTFRGQGLGLALLDQCKAYVRDFCGCEALSLEAEEDMARYGKLVGLYEKAGFHILEGVKSFKMLYNGDETLRVVPMKCSFLTRLVNCGRVFSLDMLQECFARTRKEMKMWEALNLSGELARGIRLMKRMANQGHADWVQFMALVLHVGRIEETLLWEACENKGFVTPKTQQHSWIAGYHLRGLEEYLSPEESKMYLESIEVDLRIPDGVGLHNVVPVWSHHEYLYQVLVKNGSHIPTLALRLIRYKSMIPLLEKGVCDHIMTPEEKNSMKWLRNIAGDLNDPLQDEFGQQQDSLVNESDRARAKWLVDKFTRDEVWSW